MCVFSLVYKFGVDKHRFFCIVVFLKEKKNTFQVLRKTIFHLCGGEFGDGFGTFRDGVLGQFSWEDETDGSLDFATGEGGFLVVRAQFAGLTGDLAEDVVDEGVHDGHTFLGHAGVRVDLLEDLVDVDRERFSAASATGFA